SATRAGSRPKWGAATRATSRKSARGSTGSWRGSSPFEDPHQVMSRHAKIACCVVVLLAAAAVARAPMPDRVDFTRDVQPLPPPSCQRCHGAQMQMGALRLDAKGAALAGGASGPAILPGRSADSGIVKRLTNPDPKQRMPFGGQPLPAAQIDTIRRW